MKEPNFILSSYGKEGLRHNCNMLPYERVESTRTEQFFILMQLVCEL